MNEFERALEEVVQASAQYFVMQDRGDMDGEESARLNLEEAKTALRKRVGFTREDITVLRAHAGNSTDERLDAIADRIEALLPPTEDQ